LSPPAFDGRSRRGHKDGRFHPRSNIPRRTEPSFFKESRSSSRAQPRTHNADSWRRRPGFACVRPHARVGVGSPGKNPSVGGVGSLSRVDRGASVSDSRRSRGPPGRPGSDATCFKDQEAAVWIAPEGATPRTFALASRLTRPSVWLGSIAWPGGELVVRRRRG